MLTNGSRWDTFSPPQWSMMSPPLALQNATTIVEPPRLDEVIEGGHPDNLILECTVAANADYLGSGDRRHLLPLEEHRGARIVNAPRFLSLLAQAP